MVRYHEDGEMSDGWIGVCEERGGLVVEGEWEGEGCVVVEGVCSKVVVSFVVSGNGMERCVCCWKRW